MVKTPAGIYRAIRGRLGLGSSRVRRTLLGREVDVLDGTVGDRWDYDTAWAVLLIRQCQGAYFDIGCNVGLDTLISCILDPDRPVLAVDANPKALAGAAGNLFVNGHALNVRFALGFVGDRAGEQVDFFAVGHGSAASRYRSHLTTVRGVATLRVRTTTIDHLASATGLAPALLKIDVEGAERDALAGASDVARRHGPRILVEMHRLADLPMEANGTSVLEWCRAVGYDAYYLPTHERLTTPAPIASRGRCHLLLLPHGQSYPEGLDSIPQSAPPEDGLATSDR